MQQKILDNRYELERKIGEGGMARVYVGRDLRLNRRVAIKVLHSHYGSDSDFINRFQHEAHAAAILSHPNVVDVYDVGQDNNIHYIVMEYVDGSDLKALINREAPLAIDRAVAIAEAVARGLEAAHQMGLVHRDIKPQNIIVAPDGHVRITDFGIAKSHLSTALTETGVTFGTVDYISPEQAQGQPATPRSDIYALGVTLYEMLTGRLPFSGDNAVAVAMQHVNSPPTPPRRLNPQIPPQLEAVVLQALAKDPARRPGSAQEFARLLGGYRLMAQQDTVYNVSLPRRPAEPAQSRPAPPSPGNGNTGGRPIIPPPRSAAARAPKSQGSGCGVFLVGMLILTGVLGVVLLFSTGAFGDLFAQTGVDVTPVTRPTATATETPTPSPTPEARALVPSLVNLTDEAARQALQQAGLTPAPTDPRYSTTIPRGVVIEQTVPAGIEIAVGQPVTYTVSLGPELIPVPNLSQRRLEPARRQAEELGFAVNVIEEPSAITEGFIIRQTPQAGLLLQPGDTITLVVSIGDQVRFPNVIGLAYEEAERLIVNADGLLLEYVDFQGRDRLPNFDAYFPREVVSAQANGVPVRNGDYVPRGSAIVLGVRADQ